MAYLRIVYDRPSDNVGIANPFKPNPRLWNVRMLAAHLAGYFLVKSPDPAAVKRTARMILTDIMQNPNGKEKEQVIAAVARIVQAGGGTSETLQYLSNLANMLRGGEGFVHKIRTKVTDAYAAAKTVPSDVREMLDAWKEAPGAAIKTAGKVGVGAIGVVGLLGVAFIFSQTRKGRG